VEEEFCEVRRYGVLRIFHSEDALRLIRGV
jgi:hypothetical protein